MSPYGTSGPGLQPHAEALPMTPEEMLRASIERMTARGLNGEAMAKRAAENLRQWRKSPAAWSEP